MSSEIFNLQKQVQNLQKQNVELNNKIVSLQNEILILMKSKSNSYEINHHLNIIKEKSEDNGLNENQLISDNKSDILDDNIALKLRQTQEALSKVRLENAQLKRTISAVEAENAKLSTENYQLNWKIESSSKDSDALKASMDSSIDELKNQLRNKKMQLNAAKETINTLKTELQKAKKSALKVESMKNENTTIKQEMYNYQQKLLKHKKELKNAKKEIKRLSLRNNDSDVQISEMEKSLQKRQLENINLSLSQQEKLLNAEQKYKFASYNNRRNVSDIDLTYDSVSSDSDIVSKQRQILIDFNELKAFCTSLKDENRSLKSEINHIRARMKESRGYCGSYYDYKFIKYKDDSRQPENRCSTLQRNHPKSSSNGYAYNIYCQNNVNQNPDKDNKNTQTVINDSFQMILRRYINNFVLKMNLFHTKFISSLDHLTLNLEHFSNSLKHLCNMIREMNVVCYSKNDDSQEQFIKNINREIRIIETLSKTFARNHHIPFNYIPKPSQLIGDPYVLHKFIQQNDDVKYSSSHYRSRY